MTSVLYVDDEKDLLTLAKIFLEREGDFTVFTVDSADAALENLATCTYDAIVSDYQMPGMDGIAFLKQIRSEGRDTPFILFTGRGREEVVIEAFNNGADFYLHKGGEPRSQFVELAHKIRQAVLIRKTRADLSENRDYLHRIFSSLHEGVVIIDAQTHEILDINPSAARMIGSDPDQIIHSACHQFICPAEKGQCPITDLHQGIDDSERILLTTQGDQINIIKYVVPFTFQGRDCLLETFVDNTERKKEFRQLQSAYETIRLKEEEVRRNYDLLAAKEQELRESEEKYRTFVEYSLEAILIIGPGGQILFANQAAGRLVGVDEYHDLIGRSNVIGFIAPESRPDVIADFTRVAEGTDGYIARYRVITARGEHRWVESIGKTISFGGEPAIHISLRDITDRQNTELRILEREKTFRTIFRESPYPMTINQFPDTTFLEVNTAFLAFSGCTEEEVLGKTPFAAGLLSPAQVADLTERIERDGEIENLPLSLINQSGEEKEILLTTVPITINSQKLTITVVREVTALKQAEEELIRRNEDLHAAYEELTSAQAEIQASYHLLLEKEEERKESEEKYRLLTEKTNDTIYQISPSGTVLYVSPQVSRYGYTPEDLISHPIEEFICEEDMPAVLNDLQQSLSTSSPTMTLLRLRGKDGRLHWVEDNGSPVPAPDGSVAYLSGILRDISDRKKHDEEVRESERKFSILFRRNPLPLTLVSAQDGIFTDVNDSFTITTGYSREEIVGRRAPELGLFGDQAEQSKMISILRSTGQLDRLEMHCRLKNGEIRTCLFSARTIIMNGRPHILSTIDDVTEQRIGEDAVRKSEEHLRRANRQLTLLSGITRHDILNKVSLIRGVLDLMEMDDPVGPEKQRELVNMMKMATMAIRSQIEFTRMYQDLGSHDPVWADLQVMIPRSSLPPEITLTIESGSYLIFADPMLERVFFNLMDNSVRHGQHVSTIQVTAGEAENGLILTWEDNGIGIPPHEKDLIFERGYGKNTGLGMFLVREILALTGITIQETGEAGTGVRFEIHVPAGGYRKREEPAGPGAESPR